MSKSKYTIVYNCPLDTCEKGKIVLNPCITIEGDFSKQFAKLFTSLLETGISELLSEECGRYLFVD